MGFLGDIFNLGGGNAPGDWSFQGKPVDPQTQSIGQGFHNDTMHDSTSQDGSPIGMNQKIMKGTDQAGNALKNGLELADQENSLGMNSGGAVRAALTNRAQRQFGTSLNQLSRSSQNQSYQMAAQKMQMDQANAEKLDAYNTALTTARVNAQLQLQQARNQVLGDVLGGIGMGVGMYAAGPAGASAGQKVGQSLG